MNDEPSRPPTSFPPLHICLVAAIAIAFGVISVVGIIVAAIAGKLSINIGFVGIVIGGGILIGRSSSRIWAILFSVLGLIQSLVGGGLVIRSQFSGENPVHYPDDVYGFAQLLLFMACHLYVLVILCGKKHRAWFHAVKEPSAATRNLALTVGIVAAGFSLSESVTTWWAEQTFLRTYPVRLSVLPYDSVTGKSVQSLSYRGDGFLGFGKPESKFPKIQVKTSTKEDGLQLDLSGVLSHPLEVTVVSHGYQDARITIDRDSEDLIRVPMKPITPEDTPLQQ